MKLLPRVQRQGGKEKRVSEEAWLQASERKTHPQRLCPARSVSPATTTHVPQLHPSPTPASAPHHADPGEPLQGQPSRVEHCSLGNQRNRPRPEGGNAHQHQHQQLWPTGRAQRAARPLQNQGPHQGPTVWRSTPDTARTEQTGTELRTALEASGAPQAPAHTWELWTPGPEQTWVLTRRQTPPGPH